MQQMQLSILQVSLKLAEHCYTKEFDLFGDGVLVPLS